MKINGKPYPVVLHTAEQLTSVSMNYMVAIQGSLRNIHICCHLCYLCCIALSGSVVILVVVILGNYFAD